MPDSVKRVKIARSFGSASNSYDISARLQRYSGKHLMPWLPKLKSQQDDFRVIDLGSGTGFFSDILASQYPTVIGVDLSKQMLNFAAENRSNKLNWLAADAYKLPLQDNSIDLIYSNLMIQWCDPLEPVLAEVMRILKPGGYFIFATLTDGTLFELKTAWQAVDNDQHVIDFKREQTLTNLCNFDGKDFSSLLIEHQTQDIVLEYDSVLHLAKELKGLGANQVPNKRGKGLAGKDKWQKMTSSYQKFVESDGVYPATYCVYSGVVVKNARPL